MPNLNNLEIVEAFHCLLLSHLPASYFQGQDGEFPLRLKGGANIRLFHSSPRYSNDMDFDLVKKRSQGFLVQLEKTLKKPEFRKALLAQGITDVESSPTEAGDTGFKKKIRIVHGGVKYSTKIEASYAEETKPSEAELFRVPTSILLRYGVREPLHIPAYPTDVAIWHKALALSRRTHSQTRDLFDIYQLFKEQESESISSGDHILARKMTTAQLKNVEEVVLGFTLEMFKEQAAAYFPQGPRAKAIADWDVMQSFVLDKIGAIIQKQSVIRNAVRKP